MLAGIRTEMKVSGYEVWVRLGCTSEEQSFPQPVRFNVEFKPVVPCQGLSSDRLEDAIDYVQVMKILKNVSEEKKYHLIEHLCFQATSNLAVWLRDKNYKGDLKVTSQKLRVPVENIHDGVWFSCEMKF